MSDIERCDRGHGARLHSLPLGEHGMGLWRTWGSWQCGSGCSERRKSASAGRASQSRVQPMAPGDPPIPGTCCPPSQRCHHSHFAGQWPSPQLWPALGSRNPQSPSSSTCTHTSLGNQRCTRRCTRDTTKCHQSCPRLTGLPLPLFAKGTFGLLGQPFTQALDAD